MLVVNSYPELFTTLLGWQQYQNLWDIIVHTGLVYIPFIVMIIKNTLEPFLSQDAKSAYLISLRRVEVGLAVMLLTIMMGCQPAVTVDPEVIHYQPVCNPAVDATPGHSGTTYDGAFTNLQPVQVPLWWYTIIALSHGVTASATVGLGCQPNLREDLVQLNLTRIQSAPLRAEVQEFEAACWLPAWRKYNQQKPDISQYTTQYGNDDPEWLGSHAFLGMAGYYDTLSAPNPVPGFPYDPQRDWAQGKNHGEWGSPSCQDWWTAPQAGLYDQLKAQIKPSIWDSLTAAFTSQTAADSAIKTLLRNTFAEGYRDGTGALDADTQGAFGGVGTGLMAGIGTFWSSLSYFPKMYLLIESLPLVQAFLLMACYVFLAVAIPAAGFRFSTLMSLSFVIFSIIFWSYLWQLAGWVDSSMINALNPLGGVQAVGENFGGTGALTDMVAVLLYVVLPVFWTMFMGWAGVKSGAGVTGMIDQASGVANAGALSTGPIGRGVSMAASQLK